jgi:phage baseplate assembly protein W
MRLSQRRGIESSAGEQKIKESIRLIVGTQPGERVMRPTFGCNLRDLVFAPNNKTTAEIARYRVSEALRIWEPRIFVDDVILENDNHSASLVIGIYYRIKQTDSSQNLQIALPTR